MSTEKCMRYEHDMFAEVSTADTLTMADPSFFFPSSARNPQHIQRTPLNGLIGTVLLHT